MTKEIILSHIDVSNLADCQYAIFAIWKIISIKTCLKD